MKTAREFFEADKRIDAEWRAGRIGDLAARDAREALSMEAYDAGVRDEFNALVMADFLAALAVGTAECRRVMRENGWEVAR